VQVFLFLYLVFETFQARANFHEQIPMHAPLLAYPISL